MEMKISERTSGKDIVVSTYPPVYSDCPLDVHQQILDHALGLVTRITGESGLDYIRINRGSSTTIKRFWKILSTRRTLPCVLSNNQKTKAIFIYLRDYGGVLRIATLSAGHDVIVSWADHWDIPREFYDMQSVQLPENMEAAQRRLHGKAWEHLVADKAERETMLAKYAKMRRLVNA